MTPLPFLPFFCVCAFICFLICGVCHSSLSRLMFSCFCWICFGAGPFGTGSSTPSYGNCPIDGYWHNEDEFMTVRATPNVVHCLSSVYVSVALSVEGTF